MDNQNSNPPPQGWGARIMGRMMSWVDKNMPTRAGMANNKYLKPIAHRFLRSDLWRFNRRSVPRGVALGMLAGFIVPMGGQTFVALFLALPLRANVPIAALTTFITNPFTYPFWIAIANQIGKFMLRVDAEVAANTPAKPVDGQMLADVANWLGWLGREAAVTFFGFVVLAVVFGAIGYLVSSFGWRWWVNRKRQGLLKKRLLEQADNGQ